MTTILIVEDEESLADPLAFLLRKEGFEPIIAHDGPTALEKFAANDIDIVLLDLMLHPLPLVKRLYYVNADVYHYLIGREDQSIGIETVKS